MKTTSLKKKPAKLKKRCGSSNSSIRVWLAYKQGKVFKKFKENRKFIEMVKQFGVSKSTIIFKINIVKLINKHHKIRNSSHSLHFLKNYFKMIK